MFSAPAAPRMDSPCMRSASPPSSHLVATAARRVCAGGDGEWEDIEIGVEAKIGDAAI